jgi:murein DD-endopeptidase MepM/ murein hydrolase activator NlpD
MNPMKRVSQSPRVFNVISWGVTALVVLALAGVTAWQIRPVPVAAAPQPTPTEDPATVQLPAAVTGGNASGPAIARQVNLKTNIPAGRPSYQAIDYVVERGDSLYGIANQFNLKPGSVLLSNFDVLKDSPDSIRVGQVLKIPPIDGVYYQWQAGDTLDSVVKSLNVEPDAILSWPGNDIDLTNPQIKPGGWVMVPGGKRPFTIAPLNAVVSRSSSSGSSTSACSGGPIGSGYFVWPATFHSLSGNDYWDGHLGIDITAVEGASVYAADSGVVVRADLGWNSGYGEVVMIDHGNGFQTLYAHLSQINVSLCQSITVGQVIGYAGNTGNSFGAHLHFEIRLNGAHVNPWGQLH